MRSRRIARCSTCGLNALLCVCASLATWTPSVHVVVVVHRTERLKSTNTGRLAARMLHGAELVARPSSLAEMSERAEGEYVLYPSEDALTLGEAKRRGMHSLIVPDGTWGQAKRMARRDPRCTGLSHVRLSAPVSRYCLRRNARADGLCTLEAIAEALRELGDESIADAMQAAFADWTTRAKLVRAGAHDSETARALASSRES